MLKGERTGCCVPYQKDLDGEATLNVEEMLDDCWVDDLLSVRWSRRAGGAGGCSVCRRPPYVSKGMWRLRAPLAVGSNSLGPSSFIPPTHTPRFTNLLSCTRMYARSPPAFFSLSLSLIAKWFYDLGIRRACSSDVHGLSSLLLFPSKHVNLLFLCRTIGEIFRKLFFHQPLIFLVDTSVERNSDWWPTAQQAIKNEWHSSILACSHDSLFILLQLLLCVESKH